MVEAELGSGKGVDAAVDSMRSVKSVTSDKVGRIQINISLPSSVGRRGDTDLKALMPSESVDDMESTSKEDMPLSADGFFTRPFGQISDDRFCVFD